MKPLRNPAYLAFVRKLACSICSRSWGIEAAHSGDHGIGQKSPDTSVIPLCREHHRDSLVGLDRIGRAAFEQLHGVNVSRLVRQTQQRAEACGVKVFVPKLRRKPPGSVTLGSRLARRVS